MNNIGKVLSMLTMTLLAFPAFADTAPKMTGMPRLAIGGYDTVAYFTVGKAVPGTLEYQTIWHDARWQFASKEDLDLFTLRRQNMQPNMTVIVQWALRSGMGTKIPSILRRSRSSTTSCTSTIRNTGRSYGAKTKPGI